MCMSMEQMTIPVFDDTCDDTRESVEAARRNPFACPHLIRTVYSVRQGLVLCGKKDTATYANCHESICGELPHCVWEPFDNSAEAVARRLAFMRKEESCNS